MEDRKTVYITPEEESQLMANSQMSFTKRIMYLAQLGLSVESVIKDSLDVSAFEGIERVPKRVKELIEKGYLFEEGTKNKITFEVALAFFNRMYHKKFPDKNLPE